MSRVYKPCFDTTVDKYEFDLTDPLKTKKSAQPVCVTDNGIITVNPNEDSSSSSDEDYKGPKSRK
jgi:hypothetical protein